MSFKEHIKDTYSWPQILEEEIKRISDTLRSHLRTMGVKMNVEERRQFVLKILDRQKGTCAFAGGDDRYCWNEPRDMKLSYLKLQWGHRIPSSHGDISQYPENLILLCARCNNNIQKSRSIRQIIPELEHKLKVLKKITKD